jgi:hypothetical protein
MKKRRFFKEKSAKWFASKVNGQVNDLREIKGAKSAFSVTYEKSKKSKKTKDHAENDSKNWSPEEGRDFGYPNEFWQ